MRACSQTQWYLLVLVNGTYIYRIMLPIVVFPNMSRLYP
jgi:hypothetical protein